MMITSKDVYKMDRQLFAAILSKENVSPELTKLINSMADYLNVVAISMEELEAENERLNNFLIEINIG